MALRSLYFSRGIATASRPVQNHWQCWQLHNGFFRRRQSHGLSAIAELLVSYVINSSSCGCVSVYIVRIMSVNSSSSYALRCPVSFHFICVISIILWINNKNLRYCREHSALPCTVVTLHTLWTTLSLSLLSCVAACCGCGLSTANKDYYYSFGNPSEYPA